MTRYLGPVVNHWRCGLDEGHSLDEVKADFSCVVFFQSQAWGFSIDYNNFYVSINGNKASGSNARIRIGSGQTVDVGCLRHNVTVYRTHSDQDIWVEGQFNNTSGYMNGSSTAGGWVRVPKKSNWAVTYNANGGSGAPGNQTKWYGEDLTLQAAQPVRTGHNFAGWATSASGPVAYYPSGRYTNNSAVNLYAKWNPHTYTVSYNANGGSGAPGNQTKTYGQNLTLSSVRPYRQNYSFKGWATSPSGGVAYQPGSTYSGNSGVTLYAVWELAWLAPRITNLQATRCDSSGTLTEEGQYAKVTFNWATDRTVSSIKIACNGVTTNASGSGTSGSVSMVIGNNALSTESAYSVTITITDAVGDGSMSTTVAPMNFIMDIAPNGSVAIGKPANQSVKEFEVATRIRYTGSITGFKEQGHATDGKSYRILAKSMNTYDNLGSAGKVRIVGQIGQYTTPGSIDITMQFRSGNDTTPRINVLSDSALNSEDTSLQIIVGNDKYVYVVVWRRSNGGYYFYDLQLYGEEVVVINSDWTNSPPSGAKKFDSNEKSVGIDYPSKYCNRNGYWGFSLPDGDENDWIRTTNVGLIPYAQGGASALGTESWPFNRVWTNELNWTGNGLKGRVMKQIWSGTWSTGNITVSEINYYNEFIFVVGNNATNGGWAIPAVRRQGYPESDSSGANGLIVGTSGWTEGDNAFHFAALTVRNNGTKLEPLIKNNNKVAARSYAFDLGFTFKVDQPVRAIYGVL